MRTNTALTLGKAAKLTGISKPTLSVKLKNGIISASKDEKGNWQIEPSELARHYTLIENNPQNNSKILPQTNSENLYPNSKETPQTNTTNQVVGILKDQINDLKVERDEWKKEANKWQEQASNLLTAGKQPVAENRPDHNLASWKLAVVVLVAISVSAALVAYATIALDGAFMA